jgi:hypothetical protein
VQLGQSTRDAHPRRDLRAAELPRHLGERQLKHHSELHRGRDTRGERVERVLRLAAQLRVGTKLLQTLICGVVELYALDPEPP